MRMVRKKGNALVITLILISIILTVALGVGYLTVAEIKMQTSLEEASIAYSAAEAGIEDGLLRWRYNHDVEMVDIGTAAAPKYEELVDKVDVSHLIAGDPAYQSMTATAAATTRVPRSDSSYYDLKVTYRKVATKAIPISGTLVKDSVLEIGGFDSTHYLAVNGSKVFIGFSKSLGVDDYIEVSIIHFGGTVDKEIYSNSRQVPLFTPAPGNYYSPFIQNGDVIKVRAWSKAAVFKIDYQVYATKTVGGVTTNLALDTGETTIESIGYYGETKRKLVAIIDRKSGLLLGIFDMLLYSGEADVIAQ